MFDLQRVSSLFMFPCYYYEFLFYILYRVFWMFIIPMTWSNPVEVINYCYSVQVFKQEDPEILESWRDHVSQYDQYVLILQRHHASSIIAWNAIWCPRHESYCSCCFRKCMICMLSYQRSGALQVGPPLLGLRAQDSRWRVFVGLLGLHKELVGPKSTNWGRVTELMSFDNQEQLKILLLQKPFWFICWAWFVLGCSSLGFRWLTSLRKILAV